MNAVFIYTYESDGLFLLFGTSIYIRSMIYIYTLLVYVSINVIAIPAKQQLKQELEKWIKKRGLPKSGNNIS